MSDLLDVRQKVEEGVEWRGSITVNMDGKEKELTVRQLSDNEFWEVMSLIDREELEALESSLPEGKMEELEELRDADEDNEERIEELQAEIEEDEVDIFDALSEETFEGLQVAAKYAVEPDETDVQSILAQNADKISENYGATTNENARQYVTDHIITPMIEDATGFVSFQIGLQALTESLDDEGN